MRTAGTLLIVILFCAWPGRALAETPAEAFEHSPRAQQALTDYQRAVTGIEDQYREQTAVTRRRFVESSATQVKHYQSLLDRQVRELTRLGRFDAAEQVQAMRKSSEEWEVVPPDADGVHFLNKLSLEVPLSEPATKHGVNLLVRVERAGAAYQKQTQTNARVYTGRITSERQSYRATLKQALVVEQRAGKLDAVKEIQQAIDALDNAAPAEPPVIEEAGVAGPLKPAAGGSFAGYYMLNYHEGDVVRARFLVELTEKGGFVHAQSWHTGKIDWKDTDWPIEIRSREKDKLLIFHKRNARDDMAIHAITLDSGRPAETRIYWTEADLRAGKPNLVGVCEALGSPGTDLLGLADGVYTAELKTGPGAETLRVRIEVVNGIAAATQSDKGDGWSPRRPGVLLAKADGKALVLAYDGRSGDRTGVFRIDSPGKGKPAVRYWPDAASMKRGDEPSRSGTLVKQ